MIDNFLLDVVKQMGHDVYSVETDVIVKENDTFYQHSRSFGLDCHSQLEREILKIAPS